MAKKAITYILNEETLKSLANHTDIDELNRSCWAHSDRVKDDLTKSEKEIFFLISKYSVKHCGVSYMSHKTIAKQIGCSTKTVQRAYRRLESLGVIETFEAKRTSDMKQTSSIVRIIRHEEPAEEDVQQEVRENVQPETPSPKPIQVKINAFEESAYTRAELADAFDIPESVIYAANALQLTDEQFVDVFKQNGVCLRDVLFKRIPHGLCDRALINWRIDDPDYLRCLKSAAIRTAFQHRKGKVNDKVAYFLATYYERTMELMCEIESLPISS